MVESRYPTSSIVYPNAALERRVALLIIKEIIVDNLILQLFFFCTYMTIKVTILSAQPLIPPKRLYAQKVQACFDMY